MLESMYQHQMNFSSTHQVIIYSVNAESGLGNVIIGLVSSIIAALATNRGIQSGSVVPFLCVVKSFPLYSNHFFDALPNMRYSLLDIPFSQIEFYFMYSTLRQGRDIRRNHLNKLTHKAALEIDCFTNTTANFFQNRYYSDVWKQYHLSPEQQPMLQGVVNLLYEIVMYPRPPLCGIIQSHLKTLLTRFMIGVQVRIGGKQEHYTDKQFLTMEDIPLYYEAIDKILQEEFLSLSEVYIFLSTDNKNVISLFKRKYGRSLVTTTEFELGHSAPKKNYGSMSNAIVHMQRAIVDLLILQRSDQLLVTFESSYGQLAAALQSNRNSSVATFDYVDVMGNEECNIFERSNRPFHVEVIRPAPALRD